MAVFAWEAQRVEQPSGVQAEPVWHVTVEKYHSLISAGVLTPDDRVELLEELIVPRKSKNPPHSVVTPDLAEALRELLPDGWHIRSQEPVTLSHSEPEPDIAVIAGRRRDYAKRHPGPREIALVVEVTDTTQDRDRVTKKRIYASEGIAVYWRLDLSTRTLDVYSDPADDVYRHSETFDAATPVPVRIGDREVGTVSISAILPD